ncbi:MAG: amino acid permease [Candidatus ainarchaeum sp.]|nr:amino acid permease [Candidatus ainarchaeum sp.]
MPKMKHVLSLFDAVNVALGAIIGAGIFVIIGIATSLSGPAVFLSVIIAGVVAAFTGVSTAELAKKFPISGGAYTFASRALSPSVGFVTGWVWLFSNLALGATVSLGFGSYLAFFFPSIPVNLAAAAAVVVATLIQLAGVRQSAGVNNVLVSIKVLILLVFIGCALFFFKPSNFVPLMPFGFGGVLAGAAAIFFAYSGFARVAVIADEIKDPVKNVPRATLLSIAISTVLYIAVAVAAVGLAGYAVLAASDSPLSAALDSAGLGFGAALIGAGALVATGTVLLAAILGVSRVAQKMAEDRLLPAPLASIDKRLVPGNAIILCGAAMVLLALTTDLTPIAYIGSFSFILYYAATNLSGIRVLGGTTRHMAVLGVVSCIVLMFSLPSYSWAVGAVVVVLGIAYYVAEKLLSLRRPS